MCGGMSAGYFMVDRSDDACFCGFDLWFPFSPLVAEDAATCDDLDVYDYYRLYDDVPVTATPAPGTCVCGSASV